MSKSKNYNSIVFLTTLSVYLGLVLVGAPPAVLAQAALTQKIEIKNEAEIKDDLDKKPDDEKALAIYVSTLENLLLLARDFSLRDNPNLPDNKYEFDCYITPPLKIVNTSCPAGKSGRFWRGYLPSIQKIISVFPSRAENDREQIRVNLILSDDEFFVKTILYQNSAEHAKQYQNFYAGVLKRIKLFNTNDPHIDIYENTSISFEKNQFFIVTRLARASIDEILAKNAPERGEK